MKRLEDFFQYLRNRKIVKEEKSNPKNYEAGAFYACRAYLNAITDIFIYQNS
jgi:hypothetical protein